MSAKVKCADYVETTNVLQSCYKTAGIHSLRNYKRCFYCKILSWHLVNSVFYSYLCEVRRWLYAISVGAGICRLAYRLEHLDNLFFMKVGDRAPEVWGVNQEGKEIKLSDYKGRKVALYFYPKDNTSGCTAEACSLRNGYDELRAAGYEVVGVSKDGEASHRKFIEKQSLPFDLIADTDTSLNQAFGVWAEKKLYGRTYMGTLRTTFIINEEGVIERIIDKVDTKNHAAQILNDK